MAEVNYFDRIIQESEKLEWLPFTGYFSEVWLHPKDYNRLNVNKVSIKFMQIINRNRKLRNNKWTKQQ